jgi:UDP-N-acetylglucosamine/UDP-N-acetylgalactosamine diphosphorylase
MALATQSTRPSLRDEFARHGQEHVFRFWERLDASARERLLAQAARLDLAGLGRAFHEALEALTRAASSRLQPPSVEPLPERGGDPARRDAARARGEQLLRAGRVAAFVVAGGQGTRLGFDGPKGALPFGPVTTRSLFELQAQKIRGLARRAGRAVPWYVMTSPATDARTREHFERARWFGLDPRDVFLFSQGTVPAFDSAGRLMLEAPDRIAESPDGHGGSLIALAASGALDHMEARGVDTIFYYQVDNPLVRIGDPLYLGFHDLAGADFSCKVIRKTDPLAKMGIVALVEGRHAMVEYTELDERTARSLGADGTLRFWAGNIAVHAIRTAFARRIAGDADRWLPYHASAKRIPALDDQGRPLAPAEPNGYKLERFVFDALPAAERVCVVEARASEEFSPIKNADGPNSPASARDDLQREYRRWLAEAGIAPPPADRRIELDHSRFDGPEDVAAAGIREVRDAGDAIRIAPGRGA